jgi:hypothetical protein
MSRGIGDALVQLTHLCCIVELNLRADVDSLRSVNHRFSMKGLVLIGLGLAVSGCGEEAPSFGQEIAGAEPSATLEDPGSVIVVRDGDFSTDEAPATSVNETLPRIVSLTGPNAVTNGGTALLHVQLSPPIPSPTFVVQLAGDAGYHTVVGVDPEGDGVYDISVRVSGEAAGTSLMLGVALLDAAGNAGPQQALEVRLVPSGTGDVKVTLSFDRLHDLDLHVLEPTGDQIFYQRPGSTLGGRLDLDSGANCEPSAANTENVFWPPGGAPAGRYTVSVQNYQQCSPGAIAFDVTVEYGGRTETYEGTFADGTAAEEPTSGNVRQIATFELEP